jgi:hypothetical protein
MFVKTGHVADEPLNNRNRETRKTPSFNTHAGRGACFGNDLFFRHSRG